MVRSKIFEVKITPKDYDEKMDNIVPIFTRELRKEITDYAKDAKKIFQKHIPLGKKRRTGRTRSTKSSVHVRTEFSNRKMQGTIRLSTDNPKVIEYQDRGTGFSPGRYVPGLNRRIKTGMHPGVPALNIIDKTKNDMEIKADETINKLQKRMNFSIRKAF